MFFKHRSGRSKLLCKNDVFKRLKMFLRVLQNSQESICVGVSFWKNRMIKKTLTQVFSCEFCKIFKNTYFDERLTANGCLLIYFMKINHLPQRDQKNIWDICQLWCCCTPANICNIPQKPHVSTWSVLTNQVSNLVRWNYKFSLNLRAEEPNKPTFLHKKEIVWSLGRAVKLNLWTCKGSNESQKSVSFHLGEIW